MGKFLMRFGFGAILGLLAIWLWSQLNQEDDDDFDDDDEVIEIPVGNKQAGAAIARPATPEPARDDQATHAKVAAPPPAEASDGTAANLEWVEGIGPAFNRILSDAGIKTNRDLAHASVAQLRATGINRNDEEFASWIDQAKQRIAGK